MILRLSLPKGALRGLAALCLALCVCAFVPQYAIAQSAAEAQLAARVQDLESSVRSLTGQIEQLQHTVQLLQQQLQKSQDDNEFRFQQLESGGGKKAASSGRTSSATTTAPSGQKIGAADEGSSATPAPTPLVANDNRAPAADIASQPSDGLGDSQDPLLGKGGGQSATLGTLPAGQGSALDLNLDSSQPISSGDAEAQYKAGYDAIVRGDYPFAEDQFRQFVQLYPTDPQAPDATNWLGEALLQQQNYDDAADILLKGYQAYQNSARAPDLLLKLAIAMAGAGEQDVACRTFFKVGELYPKQPQAFVQKLKDEKAKAQCKV
jgi:tol-pal system protein YbgF